MSEYFCRNELDVRGLTRKSASRIDTGEIRRERATSRIASLLPDRVRNEVKTTRRPLTNAVIAELVDDIFLPLVSAGRAKPRSD
jgi:hypothetical protein